MLVEDETDLLLFPPLRSAWALRGEQARVELSGFNAKRVFFGAMNIRNGHRLFLARDHHRAPDFQEFLCLIHDHYRAWEVALLMDEDPSHTAAGSVHLARDFGIEPMWLPKRSPELNPMDHLWRDAKQTVLANRQYSSIEEEVTRFMAYVRSLSAKDALRKAGILSPDFWLR